MKEIQKKNLTMKYENSVEKNNLTMTTVGTE